MDPEDLLRRMVLEIAVIFGYDPADPARSVEAAALLSGVSREAESARRGATDLVTRFIGATVEGAAYGLITWEIAREAIRFYGLTSQTSRPVHARANPRLVARRADADSASGPE
jgi:hypothetical protein